MEGARCWAWHVINDGQVRKWVECGDDGVGGVEGEAGGCEEE